MNKKIVAQAIVDAGITTAYIMLIASFLFNLQNIFGQREPEDTILIPVIMLMLFVISAAITGFAVFGKPAMWYLDGRKKDALSLLGLTIVFLAIFALFFIAII